MTSLLKKVIGSIELPDIRKVYKHHRRAVHFLVRNAINANDGHFDRYITARDGHHIPVRIYQPGFTDSQKRIILFFHGGGWVVDDIDRYHKVCRQLAEITGSYVVSVDYRLAPENKYPTGFNDCYEAARRLFCCAAKKGYSSHDIILAGDSAGGNLAAAVALKARDTGDFRVHRQILVYPAAACEFGSDSPFISMHEKAGSSLLTARRMQGYLELYLNDMSEKKDPYVAPYYAKSLADMPETLIITAEHDPLRDEGEAYGKKLYKSGSMVMAFRIKDAYHGFFATDLYRHPHAVKALSMIKYFIRLTD